MEKLLVIGRHQTEIPGYNVRTQDVTWSGIPLTDCGILSALMEQAANAGAKVVLQNTPAALVPALVHAALTQGTHLGIGIILSKPGPRPAGVTTTAQFGDFDSAQEAARLVRAANPNAKVDVVFTEVVVTVDPPMKFEFDRIVWL